jgi:hypothetical protein
MFKRKLNCICNKSLFCCASKLNTKKMLIKTKYKYGNIPPMNDFGIVILGYCIHFFGLVAFFGLQCLISNTPCNFQRFCIGKFVFLIVSTIFSSFLQACPCILWDEPLPSCGNPNDAQQDLGGLTYQQRPLNLFHLLCLGLEFIPF